MSLNSLTPTPAAAFDMPLAVLTACHERILRFCDMLERMVEHIESHGVDLQAKETAKIIHRYFSTAGKHHHEDEEEDLFPLLLDHDRQLQIFIDTLTSTHDQLDQYWARLQSTLLNLDTVNIELLRQEITNFVTLNREHVQLENRELLPRAATLLTMTEQEVLGKAMAKRRGTPYESASYSKK